MNLDLLKTEVKQPEKNILPTTSILNDSGLEKITHVLNTKSYYSEEVCESILSKGAHFPKTNEILFHQNTITNLRNFSIEETAEMNSYLEEFVSCEKRCTFFFEEKNSLDSLEEDTFGQLIFQHSEFKILNHIPFLIMLITYMKIFFVPFMSVIFPLFAYFLPYLLIKYVWKMPIPYKMYQDIMGKMWSFSLDMSPQKMLQNLFTLFTLAQSMYQPIQNAFHLYTIHTNIYELGNAIYDFKSCTSKIQSLLEKNHIQFHISDCLNLPDNDSHRTFIEILEQPHRLWLISKDIAKLDVLWAVSQNSDFTKVNLYSSTTPFFHANGIVDINLEKGFGSSITIANNKNHYLLSGPNGGGKSSFLRGMLQTVVLSQSFGYSVAKDVEMSPFDFILSGLHIVDNPGKQSLFEKEILFARDVLYNNNPEFKGFVVFDEIFHSTNPPDGIRTSKLFLDKLWSFSHFASIISTHVFEIIETAPESIQRICVNATKEEDGMHYSYCISEGICKESSVDEIWKKTW